MVTKTPETIKKDVIDSLYWDGRVDASKINVTVEDDEVILEGTVPTYAARRAASQDTQIISGVSRFENNLEVKTQFKVTPTDTDVAGRIRDILMWDCERPFGRDQQLGAASRFPKSKDRFVTLADSRLDRAAG